MDAKQQCHEQIVRACRTVLTVDIQRFESELGAVAELVSIMEVHAEAAIAALERVIETFDAGPNIDPGETLVTGAGVPVVDIAFIARVYLRQRCDRIVRLVNTPNSWLVVAESASLRRHIVKSMIRVEQAVCAESGRTTELEGLHDLDIALASREVYQTYIRAIRSIAKRVERGALDVVTALRLSAASVAKIVGRDIYEHLRVEDRQQLRALQQRIFAAVQQPDDELSIRRLWMDIQSSAELLERIHERSELVEHDFELLSAMLGRRGDEPLQLDDEVREALRALEGRDPEVDRALEDPSCPEPRLRASLIELHDRLARSLGRDPIGRTGGSREMHAW